MFIYVPELNHRVTVEAGFGCLTVGIIINWKYIFKYFKLKK